MTDHEPKDPPLPSPKEPSTETLVASTGAFSPEVQQSLVELRKIAKAAKSKDDPLLRKATPEEIALAETLKAPHACAAHSSRTGLPCELPRMKGLPTCNKHGSNTAVAKAAAQRRYLAELDPTLNRIVQLRDQNEHLPTAFKASEHIVERAIGVMGHHSHEGRSTQITIGILNDPRLTHLATGVEVIEAQPLEDDENV